jgi:hypothetical protein
MFDGKEVVKVLGMYIGFEYRCLKSVRFIETPSMADHELLYY